MKKICFFNSSKNWGGGEKWHFETAKILWEKGYEIIVLGNINSIKYQINTTHAFLGACVEFSQGDNFCIDSFNYYQDDVDSIPPVLTIKPEQTTYISKIQIVKDQGITMFEETASGKIWNIIYK